MQTFKNVPAGQVEQLLAEQGIGPDRLVTVLVEESKALTENGDRPKLSDLIANSPLADLEFESEGVRSSVREVEL
ncbi:MAG: hypothetical protein AAGE92_11640 [Cyanobacteria bacterium P01_G01_bin.4]